MPVRPLTDLRELLGPRTPRTSGPAVVAVDGPSGSGKTVLAERLAPVLDAAVLHMDDLYPGWDGLATAPGLLVEEVLAPLRRGDPAAYHRWDWSRSTREGAATAVPDTTVLVVEGAGSGALPCAPYLDLLLWVDAPRAVRVRRALERDGETYRPHWDRWERQERRMFGSDRTQERADLLVDGAPRVAYDPVTDLVTD